MLMPMVLSDMEAVKFGLWGLSRVLGTLELLVISGSLRLPRRKGLGAWSSWGLPPSREVAAGCWQRCLLLHERLLHPN
jgi:hypothetical protein